MAVLTWSGISGISRCLKTYRSMNSALKIEFFKNHF